MILNKTTNELINIKITYANKFFKRFNFMRFEIDVYFLDKNKVVFEKTSLKPWKYYKPEKQARYILETKKDLLKIRIGDELDFI